MIDFGTICNSDYQLCYYADYQLCYHAEYQTKRRRKMREDNKQPGFNLLLCLSMLCSNPS